MLFRPFYPPIPSSSELYIREPWEQGKDFLSQSMGICEITCFKRAKIHNYGGSGGGGGGGVTFIFP